MSNANPLGALMEGFAGGVNMASSAKRLDAATELERQRLDIINRQQQDASSALTTTKTLDNSAPIARSVLPSQVESAPGKPFKTNDPVDASLAPHQRAFLNAIAGGESGGRYDIRYDGKSGATFTDFSRHPGIMAPTKDGRQSSAAGRYQFTKSTWDSMGGGDFSPAAQDRRAWQLAQQRYKAVAGRDLDADLQRDGMTPKIASALSSTWEAFKHAPERHVATYQDSLRRYAGGAQFAQGQTPPAPRRVASALLNPAPPSGAGALAIMSEIYPDPRSVFASTVPTI